MLGALFLFGDLLVGPVAVLFAFVIVVTSLDPPLLVFEKLLPHPYHRNLDIIFVSWVARLVISTLCTCDFIRFIWFFCYVAAIWVLMGISILKLTFKISRIRCICIYNQFRITVASVSFICGRIVGWLTLFIHFCTIFWFWIGLRCWKHVPAYVGIFSILTGIIYTIGFSIILVEAEKAREMARSLISKHKAIYFSKRKNSVDRKYYFYCLWRSQLPVGLPCGSFFVIERTFAMAYLRELANNVASAMLLILPY